MINYIINMITLIIIISNAALRILVLWKNKAKRPRCETFKQWSNKQITFISVITEALPHNEYTGPSNCTGPSDRTGPSPSCDLLDACLGLGQHGEDEGRRLVGVEGGRDDQVLSRLQAHQLHHLPCVDVAFHPSHRHVSTEESGWEFPLHSLVLQRHNLLL